MSYVDAIGTIISEVFDEAEGAFPEFFASLKDGQLAELKEAAGRLLRQSGRALWKMDAATIKESVMRNWNGVAFMIIGNLAAEQKNNGERIMMFIGKAIAIGIAAVPAIMSMEKGE